MRSIRKAQQSIDIGVGPTQSGEGCSEVGIGLLCAFCATLVFWLMAIPFFDIVGVAWIKSWPNRFPPPITLDSFKERMRAVYRSPAAAFAAMDTNKDDFADRMEFVKGTATFRPPLNRTEALYAFWGLDQNGDGLLESLELVRVLCILPSPQLARISRGL